MLRRGEGCYPRATGDGGLVTEKKELKRPAVLRMEELARSCMRPSIRSPESWPLLAPARRNARRVTGRGKERASWKMMDARSTGQSLLQSASVRPRTRELYLRARDQFVLLSLAEGHQILTTSDVEAALLLCFDVLWMDGQ